MKFAKMLPSLQSLVREQSLLKEVLRSSRTGNTAEAGPGTTASAGVGNVSSSATPVPFRIGGAGDGLQHLPPELLAGIGEHFLDSPVWHACQLGEVSAQLGKVFMDEALWGNLFKHRFRNASRSRSRGTHQSLSPSTRLSYAELHELEARFRGGQYRARSLLENSHRGAAVMDLQVAPMGDDCTVAFAALRDGAIAVYALEPMGCGQTRDLWGREPGAQGPRQGGGQGGDTPRPAAALFELSPEASSGPALCCLPVAEAGAGAPRLLVAGHALGRLSAWRLADSAAAAPGPWAAAHGGRVSALAQLGTHELLSAASDGMLKAWALEDERMGDLKQTFAGHTAAVASVAASLQNPHLFLSGSHDRSVRLWDARLGGAAGATVARWQQHDWVTCVSFHPTIEDRVLTSDKAVHHWDLRCMGAATAGTGNAGAGAHLESSHRHRKLVSRFRTDPLRLASCSLDGSVKVSSLEAPNVRVASPYASPHCSPVLGPTPAPVLPEVLRGLTDGADVCTLRTSTDYVLCIDFDATRLLAGGVDGRVDVYDFSHPGHFSQGPSKGAAQLAAALALARRGGHCGDPVDMEEMQEIEV